MKRGGVEYALIVDLWRPPWAGRRCAQDASAQHCLRGHGAEGSGGSSETLYPLIANSLFNFALTEMRGVDASQRTRVRAAGCPAALGAACRIETRERFHGTRHHSSRYHHRRDHRPSGRRH
ncbi:hypothetical protein MPLB_170044 [Mesorhizobium sp. ORS 3324]|nr:hypothetical protein MPLB_170044 [Mesorhizobium sp. ORS 3324]